jgi:hypothetical protein
MAKEPLPTPTRSPRLPPELIDAAIDQLHDDQEALALCALVCKSWVPASRHHLFPMITVCQFNIADFVRLLSSTRCTISGAIVHLVLLQMETLSNLHEITQRLPRVTRLSFHDSSLCETNFPEEDIAPLLPNLEHLGLCFVRVETSHVLLWILHRSPRLRNICASDTTIVEKDINGPTWIHERALTPELKSFEVFRADPLLEFFVARWNGVVPEIVTLDIGGARKLEGMLMAVGSSLQILRLYHPFLVKRE